MALRLHAADVMAITLRKLQSDRLDRASAVLDVLRAQIEERDRILGRLEALQQGVGLIATDDMRKTLRAQMEELDRELLETSRAAVRMLETTTQRR